MTAINRIEDNDDTIPLHNNGIVLVILNGTLSLLKARTTQQQGWPEVLFTFFVTLSHSVPRHYTCCKGISPTS